MKTIFEEMGGSYNEVNGYLIPNLVIQESEPIGKYGHMRRQYLKEQHPIIFSELLLSGHLYPPSGGNRPRLPWTHGIANQANGSAGRCD